MYELFQFHVSISSSIINIILQTGSLYKSFASRIGEIQLMTSFSWVFHSVGEPETFHQV